MKRARYGSLEIPLKTKDRNRTDRIRIFRQRPRAHKIHDPIRHPASIHSEQARRSEPRTERMAMGRQKCLAPRRANRRSLATSDRQNNNIERWQTGLLLEHHRLIQKLI